jgi:hypothetical protein
MIWLKAKLAFFGVAAACWAYPEYAVPLFLGLTAALEVFRDQLHRLDRKSAKLDREIAELRAKGTAEFTRGASRELVRRCEEAFDVATGQQRWVSPTPLADVIRLRAEAERRMRP